MAKIFGRRKERDLTKERLERVVPVAKEALKLIANAELPMGDVHERDNHKFDAVAKDILKLMLDARLKYVEKEFLFQLILQPVGMLKEVVLKSLSNSFDKVIEKLLKKEFRDTDLQDMDNLLQQPKGSA